MTHQTFSLEVVFVIIDINEYNLKGRLIFFCRMLIFLFLIVIKKIYVKSVFYPKHSLYRLDTVDNILSLVKVFFSLFNEKLLSNFDTNCSNLKTANEH